MTRPAPDTPDEWQAAGREVGEFVNGTCTTLYGALEQLELPEGADTNSDFCNALDNTAMECTCCGWWHNPCDLNDNCRCNDCAEDDDT